MAGVDSCDSSSEVDSGAQGDMGKSDSMSETSQDGLEPGPAGDSAAPKQDEVVNLAADLLSAWDSLKVSSASQHSV